MTPGIACEINIINVPREAKRLAYNASPPPIVHDHL
jgi:hypothetical protein